MNKRIRKKHRKKALQGLLALCDDYETVRKIIFRKALRELLDAYGKSPEEFSAAFQSYMRAAWLLASSGPLPWS